MFVDSFTLNTSTYISFGYLFSELVKKKNYYLKPYINLSSTKFNIRMLKKKNEKKREKDYLMSSYN